MSRTDVKERYQERKDVKERRMSKKERCQGREDIDEGRVSREEEKREGRNEGMKEGYH